jgi:hypothetical protein
MVPASRDTKAGMFASTSRSPMRRGGGSGDRPDGNDTGVVLRLDPAGAAEITIEAAITEDARTERFRVPLTDLADGPVRHELGGAGLHVTVERIADVARLPLTLTGELSVRPPVGEDSALYVHAVQADGHEAWTSPLFLVSG